MQCFFLFLVGPAETTSLFQATTFQDHLNTLLGKLLRLESPERRLQIIIEQLNLKLALYLLFSPNLKPEFLGALLITTATFKLKDTTPGNI